MVGWDRGQTLAERFRAQAGDARHLYGYAMRGMADDWEAGGPVRLLCAGHEAAPPGSALQLRILAGVFRLVLAGRAPELEPYYPCLGGREPPEAAWPVLRNAIGRHLDELRPALDLAPQTNEPGRSAALLAALFDLVARTGRARLRLLEVGASAGLNLLPDRYRIDGPGWSSGPPDSPLRLREAVSGPSRAVPFEVVARRGCDLRPLDAAAAEDRVLLTSYVWPFDVHRHARLAAALAVARTHRVRVDAAPAGAWLETQLAQPAPDELTVVWHSITRLYWPPEEVTRVERALRDAAGRMPLARVSLEFDPAGAAGSRPELRTVEYPGDGSAPVSRLLGTAHPHGVPVRLEARPSPAQPE